MSAREGKRWNNEKREWVVENLQDDRAGIPSDDEDILGAARERAKATEGAFGFERELFKREESLLTRLLRAQLLPALLLESVGMGPLSSATTRCSACLTTPARLRSNGRIMSSLASWCVLSSASGPQDVGA